MSEKFKLEFEIQMWKNLIESEKKKAAEENLIIEQNSNF